MDSHSPKLFCALSASFILSSCGSYVPRLQEGMPDQRQESLLVGAINQSIKCDISNAVIEFVKATKRSPGGPVKQFGDYFLNGWGAQVALSLTVEEKSGANPTVVGLPPSPASAVFSIGLSANASADALRNSKVNYFFSVRQLYDRRGCATGIQPIEGAPSPLIQNDLQIKSWLFDQLPGIGLNEISLSSDTSGVFKQNVLQQELKFDIVTAASLTPAWRLTYANINQSGTFLSGSRDRTSDLIVTFGPLDPKQKNNALIPEAEQAHFALQNAYATQVGLQNALGHSFIFPF